MVRGEGKQTQVRETSHTRERSGEIRGRIKREGGSNTKGAATVAMLAAMWSCRPPSLYPFS